MTLTHKQYRLYNRYRTVSQTSETEKLLFAAAADEHEEDSPERGRTETCITSDLIALAKRSIYGRFSLRKIHE